MKLPHFDYRAAQSLDEALSLLAALGSDAKVLAGGQSLLPMMRYRVVRPHVLVDISCVPELRHRAGGEGLIGAMVTHADLEGAADDTPLWQLVAAHARQIAYPAVRNKGTVGGSLIHADPAADWPLLFCALHAQVRLASIRGERELGLDAFLLGPLEVGIDVDELLTGIVLPERARGLRAWGRAKLMHRAGEYATCAAVTLQDADGAWSCWAGATGTRPQRLSQAEALLGAPERPGAAQLFEALRHDLDRAMPQTGPSGLHRHATNAMRAIEAACNPTLERYYGE